MIGYFSHIDHYSVFSYDPEGTSLEGLGFGEGDGQGLTVGGGAEGLENGWEGKAGGCPLVCARWGSAALVPPPPACSLPRGAAGRRALPLPPSPGAAPLDFELPGRMHLQRWCRGAHRGLRGSQSERPASFQAMPPSGAVASLSYSPGICKSDVNVAFGAAMVLGLLVLASSTQSHSRMVCPLIGRAAVVPDGGEGGCHLAGFRHQHLPSLPSWALARLCLLGEHGSWAGWPCL